MEHHFYDLDWWYKTQPDFRHSVLLMIARAQAAPKLKIGNMDDLNLESYLAVSNNIQFTIKFYLMNGFRY